MKKITAISALSTLAVAALLASGPAAAQTATLSFNGAISGATCTIALSGGGLSTTLPTKAVSDFTNNVAGKTLFSVVVSGCNGANGLGALISTAVPSFDSTSTNVDTTNNVLKNIAAGGPAAVELQILDMAAGSTAAGTPILLGTAWTSAGSALPAVTPQKVTSQTLTGTAPSLTATFPFAVQYWSQAPAAGQVSSSVPITMMYF